MAISETVRPSLELERRLWRAGFGVVAGVDEVGRGSWAGPVVAAAVVLPVGRNLQRTLKDVRDSKQLTARARDSLVRTILDASVTVAVGWASHHCIDQRGIAFANRRAMLRAICRLRPGPDALLVDHFRLPESDLHQVCVTRGDSISLSIASASILAKVLRDRWMTRFDMRYPGYGFAENKGYGTAGHLQALERLGPCPLHRRSFAPVAAWSL